MCNIIQYGNLWVWLALLCAVSTARSVIPALPMPDPLPSRCSSKITSFNNCFLKFPAWVRCPFYEETTSSGSQGPPEGQSAWYSHPTEEGRSPALSPATSWTWVHPCSYTHHIILHSLDNSGTASSWKQGLCLPPFMYQSLGSYQDFIDFS